MRQLFSDANSATAVWTLIASNATLALTHRRVLKMDRSFNLRIDP